MGFSPKKSGGFDTNLDLTSQKRQDQLPNPGRRSHWYFAYQAVPPWIFLKKKKKHQKTPRVVAKGNLGLPAKSAQSAMTWKDMRFLGENWGGKRCWERIFLSSCFWSYSQRLSQRFFVKSCVLFQGLRHAYQVFVEILLAPTKKLCELRFLRNIKYTELGFRTLWPRKKRS